MFIQNRSTVHKISKIYFPPWPMQSLSIKANLAPTLRNPLIKFLRITVMMGILSKFLIILVSLLRYIQYNGNNHQNGKFLIRVIMLFIDRTFVCLRYVYQQPIFLHA